MAPRSLSKRAGMFMGAQFAANVVGVVTTMVLARAFTTEDMGSWQQLMRTYFFLASFLIMGLPSSLTYFYPTTEDSDKPTAVYMVVGALGVLGLLLAGATYLGAPMIAALWDKARLVGLLERFCLYFAFTLAVSYMQRLLVSTDRYRYLMMWLPLDRFTNLLAFALPAYMGYPLETVLTVGVALSAVKFVAALGLTFTVVPPVGLTWNPKLVRRIAMYSVPLGLSAAAAKIGAFIDQIIIGRFESTEFFAVFALGATGIRFLPVIATSVMTVLLPELARLHGEHNYRQFLFVWHESIRKVGLIVLGVFAFVEFFATPFIVTLYSEKYLESVPYFRLYQLKLVFRVTMFGYVLQSLGRTRIILYVTLLAILVRTPLAIGLYVLAGPYGIPVASLIISTGVTVFYVLYLAGKTGRGLRGVWPWSYYLRILAAAVGAGAVSSLALLVPRGLVADALAGISSRLAGMTSLATLGQLLMGGAIFAPVYVGLLFAFRTIKGKDLVLLRDVTTGRFMKK